MSAGTLLGVGPAIVSLTAAAPLLFGGAVLESYIPEFGLLICGPAGPWRRDRAF